MIQSDDNTPLLRSQNAAGGKSRSKPALTRPAHRRRRSSFDATVYNAGTVPWIQEDIQTREDQKAQDQTGLSLSQILLLTICMAGVQFTCMCFLKICFSYML